MLDITKDCYEREDEATMKPQRRAEDQGIKSASGEEVAKQDRRWDDVDRDSIVQIYREMNATAERISDMQLKFLAEVNTLERRVSKYNGLWERQDKQDRALSDLSTKVDTRIDMLTDSIKTLSNMHVECMAVRRGQSNTIKWIKEYLGWILATALSIRALWRG